VRCCDNLGVGALSELLRIPLERDLGDRIKWLIAVRWVFVGVTAALVWVATQQFPDQLPVASLWGAVAVVVVYNVVFWALARRQRSGRLSRIPQAALIHAQTTADLLALTAVLHLSGGLENPFLVCYVLPVLEGSVLMERRGTYLNAGLATILGVGLLLAEASGILPHYNLVGFRLATRYQEGVHIAAVGFVLSSVNFGAAYLFSAIVERLRQDEQRLREANLALNMRAGELTGLNERLRELDRARSFFVRIVAHELRAPVAAIQSYLRLILDGYVSEDRLGEIIGKAEVRARDQLELISDLLDLARLEEVKKGVAAESADVAKSLRDVLDMMQAGIQDKSLSLSVDVAPGVGLVRAGEDHVKQVWTNLISNAVKYTSEGGKIAITLQDDKGMVRGSVQDTGIGISPEDVGRIFDTFYRTKEAKALSRHGTGLGLSIVKGITERYGGRVWAESEEGVGSTFFFELPAVG